MDRRYLSGTKSNESNLHVQPRSLLPEFSVQFVKGVLPPLNFPSDGLILWSLRVIPALFFFMHLGCGSPHVETTGCRGEAETITIIHSLSGEPWSNWSRQRLTKEWPSTLLPHECEPNGDECGNWSSCHCDRLVAQDRVIGGICECCDLLQFSLEFRGSHVVRETLDAVIIHHTVPTRSSAKDFAKEFLSIVGYSESNGHHKFYGDPGAVAGVYIWPTQWSGVHNSIEINIRESSGGWTVHSHWSRPIVSPS